MTAMPKKPNRLAHGRQYLIKRGEDYQWITMGPTSERIGLAYLPMGSADIPCTFMFTELNEPCSLVFDAHFAVRFRREDLQELAMLLLTINANLPEGQLLLDMDGGYVYYRLKFVLDDLNISEAEILNRIEHMDNVGFSMALNYSRIILRELPTA